MKNELEWTKEDEAEAYGFKYILRQASISEGQIYVYRIIPGMNLEIGYKTLEKCKIECQSHHAAVCKAVERKFVECFHKDGSVNWPKTGKRVLALHASGFWFEGSIEKNSEDGVPYKNWHNWVSDEALFDDDVTHWMPLPEPLA